MVEPPAGPPDHDENAHPPEFTAAIDSNTGLPSNRLRPSLQVLASARSPMSDQSEPKPLLSPVPADLTGKIGKYEIRGLLGRGAMGAVYLAHDAALERDVAIKVMLAQIADDSELKKRFEREARAVAKMTHPNVVTIYELGYHVDKSPYIAMEFLEGMDLQKAIRKAPPMSVERKVTLILDVLAGLAHAHRAGIVHRDIKPANIFIKADGTVKIMDFGVARLASAAMTHTGQIVGTANYMSPEQVSGAPVDGRSDIFSVGCVFYELMASGPAFRADNLLAIFYKITSEQPNFDLVPRGEARDGLLPILEKSLAKDPGQRYQNASDFETDLREYLRNSSPSAWTRPGVGKPFEVEPRPTDRPFPVTERVAGTAVRDVAPTRIVVDPDTSPKDTQVPLSMLQSALTVSAASETSRSLVAREANPMYPTVPGSGASLPATQPQGPAVEVFPEPRPRPMPKPGGVSILSAAVLGGLVVAAVAMGFFASRHPATQTTTPTSLPSVTTTSSPSPKTPRAEPDTAALHTAQAAFESGDYDEALLQAQTVLHQDPGNSTARKILDNAIAGQNALTHLSTAKAAFERNDLDAAAAETAAARSLAPWDPRIPPLESRIREARSRAQREVAERDERARREQVTRTNQLLANADTALHMKDYKAAIAAFEQAIALDPNNVRAINGRSAAVYAEAMEEARKAAGPLGKTFVQGKTIAQSPETRKDTHPPLFDPGSAVEVSSASDPAALPGKIHFDVQPKQVKPGEKYTANIFLANEGQAPIDIQNLNVTTVINDRRVGGDVRSMAKNVAPHQKALVLSVQDYWREDTTSWSMEVVVSTSRGETYRSQVTWR
jgi:serine/threonine-protein kinase